MKFSTAALILFWLNVTFAYTQISFEPYKQYPTESNAQALDIADFNLDGLNDVAVATSFSSGTSPGFRLLVFYQNQDHDLVLGENIAAPTNFGQRRSLQAGDLNGDQRPDLVLPFGPDSVAIYYNNGAGGFMPYITLQAGNTPDVVAIGDLNSDGKNDIAVSNWNDLIMTVFFRNASNGFTRRDYPAQQGGWNEIEIADMNGDNKNDVVLMLGQKYAGIYIYHQTVNNGFAAPVAISMLSISDFPSGFAAGDLNNDGKTDLAVARNGNSPNAAMRLFYQNEPTPWTAPVIFPAYDIPQPVVISNLNCDNRPEIITAHGGWGNVSVFEQNAIGKYGAYTLFPVFYSSHYTPQALASGDLTGDGMADIALANYDAGLFILRNNSPGSPGNPAISYSLLNETVMSAIDTTVEYNGIITQTHADTIDYIQYLYTDTFSIRYQTIWETLTIDSSFLRTQKTCTTAVSDTIFRQGVRVAQIGQLYDTLLIGGRVDTILLPEPPVSELPWSSLLYPNPTQDVVFLKFNRRITDPTNITYDMFSSDGKRIGLNPDQVFWLSARLLKLDLALLPTGAYFLRIKNADTKFVHKLIKVTH